MYVLNANHISKSYKTAGETMRILQNVNLQVMKGEMVAIMGPSGSGKTTLLHVLTGVDTPDDGEIVIGGETFSQLTEEEKAFFRRKHMGMIFQDFQLLESLTVKENILLPLILERKEADIQQERFSRIADVLGIEKLADKGITEISGGQKQRVAIARALVNDPKILLCDEATSALDPRITHGILELLKQINEELGITIVVVTHQMEVVKQICQRVAFLKHGVVLAEGKPEELFVKPTEDVKKFLGEEGQVLPKAGVNVQLFFTDDSSDEPVITEMARELGIDFSICWAKLEEFRENVFGSLILNIQEKDKERVFQFLESKNVTWEVL